MHLEWYAAALANWHACLSMFTDDNRRRIGAGDVFDLDDNLCRLGRHFASRKD
jgi:hypothetical protein